MMITSPLWMRVTWSGLLLACLIVPVVFLGIEMRAGESCEPDLPFSAYEDVRRMAKWTWAGSLLALGLIGAAVLRVAPSKLGTWPFVTAFLVWKAAALVLAFITSPVCFESYGGFDRPHAYAAEGAFAFATLMAWGLMILIAAVGLILGPKARGD